MKNSGQNIQSLQIKDIYHVAVSDRGTGLDFQTTKNATLYAEVTAMEYERATIFAGLVEEYVKGIQLVQALSGQEDVIEYHVLAIPTVSPVVQAAPQQMAPMSQMGQGTTGACRKCGSPLVPGNKFCAVCGTPAPVAAATPTPGTVSFCPTCGGAIEPGAKFCMKCGAKVQ